MAHLSDAAVLLVAVVAARYFQTHQERALQVMQGRRSLSGKLSISRFNQRLHGVGDWFRMRLEALGALVARGAAVLIDSLPLPVCRRVRARRCRKVQGAE